MPILLMPFYDVDVNFSEEILNIKDDNLGIKSLNESLAFLVAFYHSKHIDFNSRFDLLRKLDVRFDDTHSLHLRSDDQEKILNDLFFQEKYGFNLLDNCSALVQILIEKYKGIKFTFKLNK